MDVLLNKCDGREFLTIQQGAYGDEVATEGCVQLYSTKTLRWGSQVGLIYYAIVILT